MEQIAEKVLQSLKEIKLAILSQEKKAQKFPEYKVEVLKSIYSSSLNPEKYDVAKINEIDSCNYLEFYLLKYFSNETRKEISFIKSLLVLINHKFRQGIVYWDDLSSENHSKTFESIIDAFFEIETTDLNNPEKIEYLQFLINLYRHQENTFIQKKCDKIISFGLWTNLSKPFLKSLFLKYPRFLKIYKTNVLAKKFTELETSFIVKLVDLFWKVIEKANTNNEAIEDESDQSIDVLEKIIEFFTDLMSQSSTRRHFRYVLLDRKFVILCKLTRLFNSSRGIRLKKLIENLQSYQDYALDEIDGTTQSVSMTTLLHYDALSEFQNILFSNFKERFETSLIKSINNIDSRKSLTEILDYLSDEEIVFVAQRLNLSIPDEKNWNENIFREDLSHIDLVIEILLDFLIKKKRPLDIVKNSALYPTEALLWDENLIPEDHDGRKTLTLPKINLQFLSLEDYLIRNFQLFRLESSYEIKKDIEDIVPRVHPNFDENGIFKSFGGWARMGTEIKEFLIQDVQAPPIGEEYPAKVLAEIKYSVGLMNTEIKHEWEALKEHDVILLISFKKLNNNLEDGESETPKSFCQEYGIQFVRGAEVVSQLDEDRNDLKDPDGSGKIKPEGSVRILQVILDSVQYKQDLKIISEKESEVYGDFQLIIRRKSKENNFKAILTTIRDLMKSDNLIPNWLEEVLLGYGDLESESYGEFKSKLSKNIDFYDTFLNYDHYKQNFIENSNIEKGVSDELLPSGLQQTSNLKEFSDWEVNLNFKNKKTPLNLHLSRKKKNSIKFTERQVEAIYKSLNEGLTLIEGPPGTGKTDVAVQICSLLYHNFSNERTLILTHSNNALNDIFEKIAKLDIDER